MMTSDKILGGLEFPQLLGNLGQDLRINRLGRRKFLRAQDLDDEIAPLRVADIVRGPGVEGGDLHELLPVFDQGLPVGAGARHQVGQQQGVRNCLGVIQQVAVAAQIHHGPEVGPQERGFGVVAPGRKLGVVGFHLPLFAILAIKGRYAHAVRLINVFDLLGHAPKDLRGELLLILAQPLQGAFQGFGDVGFVG